MTKIQPLAQIVEAQTLCLCPQGLFYRGSIRAGHCVWIEQGTIVRISAREDVPPGIEVVDLPGVVSPGFLDLQVNGGGGVMLNTTPTPDGVRAIARAHRPGGTRALMPTVITDAPEVTRRAAEAVLQVHGQDGVVGLHIEGPHINPARKGVHDPVFIRPLDRETIDLLGTLRRHDLPVMVTLAPELIEPGQIAELTRMGVVVSAGHSDATADQIEAALDEGLMAFTHLFNGMSQMAGREPGVVGAALASRAACGIIADGHHVDPRMVRLAYAARPAGGEMFLVSDAMPTWNGPDHYELYGARVDVRNGKLLNRAGSLAGAHIDMAGCVSKATQMGVDLDAALRSAIDVPAQLIGVRAASQDLVGQPLQDLVLMTTSSKRV